MGKTDSKTTTMSSQRPISRKTNSLKKNFQECMVNSTFHGLNYVGDTKLSLTERLFFVLAFLLVSLLSTYYISLMWLKWTATPIIISADAKTTSIRQIPFPATTICNMNQAKRSIAEDIEPGSLEELQLQTLCQRKYEVRKSHNFTSSWPLYKEFLLKMTQRCEEMMVMCKFGSEIVNCSKVFQTTLTDDGLCCTFNQVHRKFIQKNYRVEDDFEHDSDYEAVNWDPENGYGNQVLRKNMYPRVAAGPGSALGLTVVLNSDYDDYYCSSTNSAGFKLLIHNPMQLPLVENFGFLVRTGYHSRFAIIPSVPFASPQIRSIPKYKRQCMFTSDANLTYYRSYTKTNCELECKSSTIQKECGCVLYYMPRFNEDTRICNNEDAQCYEKIKLAIESSYNDTFSCKCIAGCFSLMYYGEMSASKFNVDGRIKEPALLKYNSNFLRRNIAMVDLFYDDTITRKNVKGTGGLLSLFMGVSFISIIEIVYYATLRPFYKSKRAKCNVEITIGEPKRAWKDILNIDD